MVEAVRNKGITRLASDRARALPRLKNVAPLDSFALGREAFGSSLARLLNTDPAKIQLDAPAKIRLLAMSPSLETRVNAGETEEQIFKSLELSLYKAEDLALYILGDPQNIALLKIPKLPPVASKTVKPVLAPPPKISRRRAPVAAKKAARSKPTGKDRSLWPVISGITNFSALRGARFQAGPHKVKIADYGHWKQLFLEIEGILKVNGKPSKLPLSVVIMRNEIELTIRYPNFMKEITFVPVKRCRPDTPTVTFDQPLYISEFDTRKEVRFMTSRLELQAIIQELVSVIKRSEIESAYIRALKVFGDNLGKKADQLGRSGNDVRAIGVSLTQLGKEIEILLNEDIQALRFSSVVIFASIVAIKDALNDLTIKRSDLMPAIIGPIKELSNLVKLIKGLRDENNK